MFVVLTTQRSGSTYLVRALDSHPAVTCYGELFINRKTHLHVEGDRRFFHYLDEAPLRRVFYPLRQRHYVDAFLAERLGADKPDRAAGFKLMYDQLNRSLHGWIVDNGVNIVHLVRENYLKSLLSREVARHSGVAHSSAGVIINPFEINTDHFAVMLEKIDNSIKRHRSMLNHFPSVCEVTYEKFFGNPAAESARILSFLGADPGVNISCDLKKISPSSPEGIIANYDELVGVLKQRNLGHLLD